MINLSSFGASPAKLWELRAQLAGLRAAGKKVVIYFDRVGSSLFMLASVADELWMDPLGDLDIKFIDSEPMYDIETGEPIEGLYQIGMQLWAE